ncbi:MAG: cation-translocating P-type ATPase [Reyranellales bacterium]
MTDRAGLSTSEAAARLGAEGPNELPRAGSRSVARIALDVMREPMFALLLASGVVYVVLGQSAEAIALLVFASASVAIAVVQESRSERVLDALRDLTSPRALVIRDGERKRIPGREVVRGDFVILSEGDRVPADGTLVSAHDLRIDESLLTGESLPVRRESRETVFSGSLVVRGQGLAEIAAIGGKSRIGRIGQVLGEIEYAPPVLQRQTRRLVRIVGIVGLACCILAVLLYGLLRGTWLDAVLAGIALGMSMLPEEFPLVLAVFMVMGAWRLSRSRVLTRRAATIESLGAATVLCTDKTGTLTENRMTIVALRTAEEIAGVPDRADDQLQRRLVERGARASAVDAFDPMDKAFHAALARSGQPAMGADGRGPVKVYALRSELLAVTQAWADDDGHVVATKGAPETIAELCGLEPAASERVRQAVAAMAADGMRVLGVAEGRHDDKQWPATPRAFTFRFLGLVGLADPVRAEVPRAVAECRSAGMRVVMITGDHPQTAQVIARQAGLVGRPAITGEDMAKLDDAALAAVARESDVFARIPPEQKLRLVRALKADGEVVAMTGDGVNDAPALKAADIGIAMGGRGTDVAREAASIVLLDDDFGSIVRTLRAGRRIYDNLRKAMSYILAVHVPIAGLALMPLLTGLPLLLSPIHIAFLEMVIDPVCSIVFEAEGEEADVMRRPPRPPDAQLLSPGVALWSLLQGVLVLALLVAVDLMAIDRGVPADEARTLVFVSLVMANMALVLVNRSFGFGLRGSHSGSNRALLAVYVVATAILLAAILWPPARSLFHFGPFHWHDLGFATAGCVALVAILESLKRLLRHRLTA